MRPHGSDIRDPSQPCRRARPCVIDVPAHVCRGHDSYGSDLRRSSGPGAAVRHEPEQSQPVVLLPALLATAEGRLPGFDLEWSEEPTLCVVIATKGYPGAYAKGTEIKGLEKAAREPGVQIFHAGTRRDGDRILADGGRVLGVTARGRDIREAQARAYAAVDKIDWPGGFCRRDIGWRAVTREPESSVPSGFAATLSRVGRGSG